MPKLNGIHSFGDLIGEIKPIDTYNGIVDVPRGWMILNGNIVNQVNYEAIHGANSYLRDRVSNSPLLNKYLDDAENKFPVGKLSKAQDGSIAKTYEGNANNQKNFQHNHQWLNVVGSATDQVYNSAGTAVNIGTASPANIGITAGTGSQVDADAYTNNRFTTTESIQPHSFQVVYIIKVI